MGQSIRYQTVEHDDNTITVDEIHKVVIHRFQVNNFEDPDLYAGEPLWHWQQTPQGQFIMKHAVDKPEWRRHENLTMGYEYAIIVEIEKKKLTEFYLKFGKINA